MKFKNLFLILLVGIIFIFLSFKSSSKVFAYGCWTECPGTPGISVGKWCCDVPFFGTICVNVPCAGGDDGETIGCFNCKEICSWGIKRDWCQTSSNCGSPVEPTCWIEGPYEADPTCCTGSPGGDGTPPVCQNVIPRTPTGGFSQIRLFGFEAGEPGWNIFNGSIYSDGWKVPAYYCGLGYCAARPPHSGSKALHLGLDGGQGTAIYQMGVTPNHVYRVSVWGMGSSRSYGEPDDKCWADVSAYLTAESGGVTKTTRVADPVKQPSWQQGSVTIWARSNTLTLTLQAKGSHCSHNSAGAVFDDLTIEELPTSTCSTQNCLLEVYATDNKKVTEMAFTNGPVGSASDWMPYSPVYYPWQLDSDGRVWAFFRDANGNISEPCSGICALNQPPNCTSMSPAHGTIIKQGEAVPLTVQASDTDGAVTKVAFYYTPLPLADYCTANWTKIGEDTDSADGWSTSWGTSSVPAGQVLVRADVYDDKGAWCTGNFNVGSTLWTSSAGTWSAARTACQSAGGDLVTINDSTENANAYNLCGAANNCWIGFNDQTTEGTFVWAAGGGSGYTNWQTGEPNDYGGNEDCAHLWANQSGKWNDINCGNSMAAICEAKAGINSGCDANKTCSDCHPVVTIEIIADPWFQTQEGDVHAQGNISVSVPAGENFCLNGSGGTPGVVSYASGTPDFSPGSVSETGWLANTSFSRKNYDYFYKLLGSPDKNLDSGNLSAIGDEVVYYAGDNTNIDITNGNFPAGKKAAILVNGNVDINDNISVPEGSFLAIIASGKIDVANSVSRIEGVFIVDGAFDTGTAATALTAEGMFVANSFDLNRDLGAGNETTPGVKFIYRPDLWLNAPAELLVPSFTWQELAP